MLQGISINERIEYICTFDKDEPKTVFILKPLSGYEQFQLMDIFENGKAVFKEKAMKNLLNLSIVEIRNFKDELSLADKINLLDFKTISELIQKVLSINKLSEEEEKNS